MYKILFTFFIFTFTSQVSIAQSSTKSDSTLKVQNELTIEADDDRIFNKAEKQPEFPGGQTLWQEYLRKNINMEVPVKNGAPAGTYNVIIRFVVGRDSTLRAFAKQTGFGYGMEDEVIRVLKQSPKWIPAKQNGYSVSFYLRQPVTFSVIEKLVK